VSYVFCSKEDRDAEEELQVSTADGKLAIGAE
jgi:hypothetical protein